MVDGVIPDNPLKQRLQAGEPALGCWLTFGSAVVAEVLGLAGYDAVMIDLEHGFAGLVETVHCLQALSAAGAAGLVRVPDNDPVILKRVLDLGVSGVMIPDVGSAEEARAAVAACRYPPAGGRGAAYGMVRASRYGMAREAYLDQADEALLLICQIESVAGLAAIEEIAAVDGVDCLFVGPYDLSGSLGKLGQFSDPDVRAAIREAESRILGTRAILGALPSLGRSPAEMVRDGVRLVLASADTGLLRKAAQAELTAFQSGLASGDP